MSDSSSTAGNSGEIGGIAGEGGSIICNICGKSFTQKSSMTRHVQIVHCKAKPHSCTVCSQSFSTRDNLYIHMLRRHPTCNLKPFACTLCNRSFYDEKALKRHKRKHSSNEIVECEFCKRPFRHRQSLNVHIATFHVKTNANEWENEYEQKYFDQQQQQQSGMPATPAPVQEESTGRRGRSEGGYSCDVCQTSFKSKINLDVHVMRYHKKPEDTYTCEVCNMQSNDKEVFEKHILTHLTEKMQMNPGSNNGSTTTINSQTTTTSVATTAAAAAAQALEVAAKMNLEVVAQRSTPESTRMNHTITNPPMEAITTRVNHPGIMERDSHHEGGLIIHRINHTMEPNRGHLQGLEINRGGQNHTIGGLEITRSNHHTVNLDQLNRIHHPSLGGQGLQEQLITINRSTGHPSLELNTVTRVNTIDVSRVNQIDTVAQYVVQQQRNGYYDQQ